MCRLERGAPMSARSQERALTPGVFGARSRPFPSTRASATNGPFRPRSHHPCARGERRSTLVPAASDTWLGWVNGGIATVWGGGLRNSPSVSIPFVLPWFSGRTSISFPRPPHRTTGPVAFPHPPRGRSPASGWSSRPVTPRGFSCCAPPLRACHRHYPGAALRALLRPTPQPYQSAPNGWSGWPVQRALRGLLSVYSRHSQHPR
jgi:hypothetical protein